MYYTAESFPLRTNLFYLAELYSSRPKLSQLVLFVARFFIWTDSPPSLHKHQVLKVAADTRVSPLQWVTRRNAILLSSLTRAAAVVVLWCWEMGRRRQNRGKIILTAQ